MEGVESRAEGVGDLWKSKIISVKPFAVVAS